MKNIKTNALVRNIAIIAHVDHGKTTLVDAMFRQSGIFRDGQKVDDRLMDRLDLEKERGITIAAKNCSSTYKGVKINIIDTPGHADFGGEVERSLSMADGAILLVDASEGPLPQTRFVLEKTLQAGLKVIVIINKIDRKDARVTEVLNEIYDLFIDLDASEEQLEFPLLYAIGRDGIAKRNLADDNLDLTALFQVIVDEIPAPTSTQGAPFQLLVSDLGYDDYLGKLAIGKITNGSVKINDRLLYLTFDGQQISIKITSLRTFDGMGFQSMEEVDAGEIIVLSGVDNVKIGDTICSTEEPKSLKRITIDEPTVFMKIGRNNSPLAGKEGKHVQATRIHDRLVKETLSNVAIQIEESNDKEVFIVKGRGEFQMAILIETMRREGFELGVGRPEVIFKIKDGKKLEPIEQLFVDCTETFTGIVTEKLSIKKGKMVNLVNHGNGRVRIEFSVPSRSLIGYRDEFLTDTKGTGIMNSYLAGYEAYRGDFPTRFTGSIVSDRSGKSVTYALFNLEPRGRLFIAANEAVYEGMVIGEHNKEYDISANPTKEKKLSNMRASGKDENCVLSPTKPMTLEAAINFINEDELVEVTPKSVRVRKAVLDNQKRNQALGKKKSALTKAG